MLLQVLPTPTGSPIPSAAIFTTTWTGNFQTDLYNVVKEMQTKGYSQLATQFRSYALQQHAINASWPVSQILQAFIALELAGGLSTGIGQTGTILGQLPQAAAKGAENAYRGLNLGSWFLRIGEILLGIVLVGVGLARITGAQNAISKIVKTKVPI